MEAGESYTTTFGIFDHRTPIAQKMEGFLCIGVSQKWRTVANKLDCGRTASGPFKINSKREHQALGQIGTVNGFKKPLLYTETSLPL